MDTQKMIDLIAQIVSSSVNNLFKNQPDIFLFTPETGETEWNLSHHLAFEIQKYFPWLDHDVELTKHNYRNKRPDVVFHKRGINALNYLVVEVKHRNTDNKDDIKKLKGYCNGSLNYMYGVSVRIKDVHNFELTVVTSNYEKRFNEFKIHKNPKSIIENPENQVEIERPAIKIDLDELVYGLYGLTEEEIAIQGV